MSVICQLLYLSLRRVLYCSVKAYSVSHCHRQCIQSGGVFIGTQGYLILYSGSHTQTQRESTQRAQHTTIVQPFHISDIVYREYHVSTAEIQSMSAVHSSGTVVRYIITLSVSYPKWISYHFISYDSH
jgi:hypothetical protein